MFLLSLDEIDRVKRMNHLQTYVDLEEATGVTRKTWREAIVSRKPQATVLQALAELGARANRILIDEPIEVRSAA